MPKYSKKMIGKVKKGMKKAFPEKPEAGVSSPTSTATKTATRTATKTSTSTDAYTARNITVTGGAGKGHTTVTIHAGHRDEGDTPSSGGDHPDKGA